MNVKSKKLFSITGALFLLFIAFTVVVLTMDVRPIGPDGSLVGLATVNQWVFEQIGVHIFWYKLTDYLGLLSVLLAVGFASLGLAQLIKRKNIKKVDYQIILLGVFYCVVISFYVLFEYVIINFRPILMNGVLEASYPSSHTILVICIMATAMMMFNYLFKNHNFLRAVLISISVMIIAVTVVGRLISGVHWFTDIIAGLILSSALVMLFYSALYSIGGRK